MDPSIKETNLLSHHKNYSVAHNLPTRVNATTDKFAASGNSRSPLLAISLETVGVVTARRFRSLHASEGLKG